MPERGAACDFANVTLWLTKKREATSHKCGTKTV
jgi:hypothetical protein